MEQHLISQCLQCSENAKFIFSQTEFSDTEAVHGYLEQTPLNSVFLKNMFMH